MRVGRQDHQQLALALLRAEELDLLFEVGVRDGVDGLARVLEGALEGFDDLRLFRHGLFHVAGDALGHLRADHRGQHVVGADDVHVDLADGPDAVRGTPGEFLGRGGFGEADELLLDGGELVDDVGLEGSGGDDAGREARQGRDPEESG